MEFDTSYLNRTANKWPRRSPAKPEFVVWHETASPNPNNPHGTLQYNLSASVQSSYNYLIARDGTIFHYVDERNWIAYHAGLHSAARGYIEWQVNVHSIGVELDGKNDGTPITPAQRDAAVALMLHCRDAYGIPLQREYHLHHKEVAPGYKSDPRGYNADILVQLARQAAQRQEPPSALADRLRQILYQRAGGSYNPEWAFHQYARANTLGIPLKTGLDVLAGGQRYTGEIYSRDAIFSPYGQWQTILRLSQIDNPELFNELIRKVYSALGITFAPGQAFYSFSRKNGIGMPLGDSLRLRVPSGAAFATQPYAFDLLYTPIGNPESATNWGDVRRLSSILADPSPEQSEAELRDIALQSLYLRLGGAYDPADPFWRAAVERKLGLPIVPPRTYTIDGQSFTCAIFAGDILCARPDDPTRLIQLSELQ